MASAHVSMVHGGVVVGFTMYALESNALPNTTLFIDDDRTTAAYEEATRELRGKKSLRSMRKFYGETHRFDDPKKKGLDKMLRRQLRRETP